MRILIAEDDQSIADTYRFMLEIEGLDVKVTGDGQDCIETFDKTSNLSQKEYLNRDAAGEQPFDAVVLDIKLPRVDGIEIAHHILSRDPRQRIIIATAYSRNVVTDVAKDLSRDVELLIKPFDLELFADVITKRQRGETI